MFKSSSINCSGWKDLCIIILHNYISVNACKPNVHFPGYSSHWNTKVVYNLFLALRKFDFNEDKLKLEYICSLPKLIQHQSSFVFSFKVVSLLLLTHKKGSKVLNGSLPEFQSYTFQTVIRWTSNLMRDQTKLAATPATEVEFVWGNYTKIVEDRFLSSHL